MASSSVKRAYGWIGAACWVLILPAKYARHFDSGFDTTLIGVVPSLLGPAGLLLVILSSEGRLAHLTPPQAVALTGGIALGLEFVQVLPAVRNIYTFDWLDVAASLIGLAAGLGVSSFVRFLFRRRR